ncbi:peptidase M3 [Synechococcus sp. H65.1]|uniref:peptidase M3 n=1 Tax=Synechococcus sp. H65.1 TaxID=2964525 RepID=UPI0039C115CB
MVFPTAEPPFERFASSGQEGAPSWNDLEEQVQQFARRYRGQVAQLSPPELGKALQVLAQLTQALAAHLAGDREGIPADSGWTGAVPNWRDLERAISLQSHLLFFPLELQSLPAVSPDEPAAELPLESKDQRLDLLVAACVEPLLRPFRQFLWGLLQQRGHQQAEPLERLLHQQRLAGRLAWRQLWQVTLASLPGQSLGLPQHQSAETLTHLQSLQTHPSAEIRWAAYQRLGQHLEAHAELGGFILSILIRDHLWEAQWRGYDSAVDLYLARHGLSQTFWEHLLDGIHDRFDLFQRYYRLKSRALGRSIRTCDLYAPWGDAAPPLTAAEATFLVWSALQEFCPECAAQAKPWLPEITSQLEASRGETDSFPWPLETPLPGGESLASLLRALAALSRRLRPEEPRLWLELEELQGATRPSWEVGVHTAFLQQMLLGYLLETARGTPGGVPLRFRNGVSGPETFLSRSLQLAQALLIYHLEAQLQAVFYQSLIARLELLLYRSGIPGGDTPLLAPSEASPTYWVSEEWLKLCQELCGDAVELLPEDQFRWVGMPELFLRPFSSHQASLASLVALACYRQYHLSPRTFLPCYLNWLASPPGSLTWGESAQLLQVDLSRPEEVLQGLEELERWIEVLEELLEEEQD